MITMIVIALALAAVGVFYITARSRRRQSKQPIRPVDVQALRTLMDRDDELFLRERLPYSRFRRLKRRRIRVTMSYVSRVASNASLVMRLSASAQQLVADPNVVAMAAQVTEMATQIRMQCMVAFAKLAVEFAMPSLQLTPAVLAPRYQALREQVLRLGALEMQNVAPAAVSI
jgi:hypothetical protein